MIRVSVNGMKNDWNSMKEDIEKFRASIGDLEEALGVLAGCWEGPGWQAFQNQVREDMVFMNELYEELEQYLGKMQGAAKIYNRAEQRAYSAVSGIWI